MRLLPAVVVLSFAILAGSAANAENILPKTTYFYDSYGNITGSATTNPMTNQTVFNNQYGGYEGTVNKTGPGQYSFTNDQGDYMGSMNGAIFGE